MVVTSDTVLSGPHLGAWALPVRKFTSDSGTADADDVRAGISRFAMSICKGQRSPSLLSLQSWGQQTLPCCSTSMQCLLLKSQFQETFRRWVFLSLGCRSTFLFYFTANVSVKLLCSLFATSADVVLFSREHESFRYSRSVWALHKSTMSATNKWLFGCLGRNRANHFPLCVGGTMRGGLLKQVTLQCIQ